MGNKCMKRCSTSLIIREIQSKTTIRYHFMSERLVVLQESTSNKCWIGWREKRTFLHCWWECKLVQPLWRTLQTFLKNKQKNKNKKQTFKYNFYTTQPVPLLGIHTKETRIERDTCTSMFITALFLIAKTWKQPICPPADEWIRKLWYIYTMVLLSH